MSVASRAVGVYFDNKLFKRMKRIRAVFSLSSSEWRLSLKGNFKLYLSVRRRLIYLLKIVKIFFSASFSSTFDASMPKDSEVNT